MARHTACKLEGRVKNPLRAAAEESSSLKKRSELIVVTDKIVPKTSKLPVPIGSKIQKPKANSAERVLNFKGLSLTEVQATKIDASVGTEIMDVTAALGTASTSDGSEITKVTATLVDLPVHTEAVFKFVKETTDLYPMHLSLADECTYNFYKNQLANFRGTDMKETVREISGNFISDEVLKDYSYLGRRKKKKFKDFDNLTRVIVASTIESMKRVYRDVHGKEEEESDDEKKKLYGEVHEYFTNEYIKKAPSRCNK